MMSGWQAGANDTEGGLRIGMRAIATEDGMRPPDPNRFISYRTYFLMMTAFLIGYAAISVFSFGRVTQDERDGPGLNPVTRLPDGRIGLSEFAIELIGFAVQVLACVAIVGLALLWKRLR